MSELGGLAFPTKTFRENRVEVPKNFAPPPKICHLLVGATHRARADPPKCQKNTPPDSWGQATNARYACVVIKRAPTGRFGSKILTLICQLYVFTSTSTGRAAAVEVPNPTNLALTDGATVDFDESGVKRRSTCTQQPTVPNAGGARGHVGSRRAKTRVGRHLARRPAWRGVDRRAPSRLRSGKKTRRRVGYPPNLIKPLGRPHPTSMGGETEQSGAV